MIGSDRRFAGPGRAVRPGRAGVAAVTGRRCRGNGSALLRPGHEPKAGIRTPTQRSRQPKRSAAATHTRPAPPATSYPANYGPTNYGPANSGPAGVPDVTGST